MSRSAKITQDFGDGTYDFRLGIGGLEELDEKTQVGPLVLLRRLESSEWRVREVREIIRIGLVGGGMEPTKALGLVKRYVDDVPEWPRNAMLAFTILAAAVSGWSLESPGKSEAAGSQTGQTAD
jgi:hypothetical protein